MNDIHFLYGAFFGLAWFLIGVVVYNEAAEDWNRFENIVFKSGWARYAALALWPLVLLGWGLHNLFYGVDDGEY